MLRSLRDFFNPAAAQRRLDAAHDLLLRVEEGRELLQIAQRDGYTISLNKDLKRKFESANMNAFNKTIEVSPNMSTAEMAHMLCHELRHVWQFSTAPDLYKKLSLSFEDALAVQRLAEGDAFVFTAYLSKKIRQQTGVKVPYAQWPDANFSLLEHLEQGDADPLTLHGQQRLFARFQQSKLCANGYDKGLLLRYLRITQLDTALGKPATTFNATATFSGGENITKIAGQPYLSLDNDTLMADLRRRIDPAILQAGAKLHASRHKMN
jgi:hypothetical protein